MKMTSIWTAPRIAGVITHKAIWIVGLVLFFVPLGLLLHAQPIGAATKSDDRLALKKIGLEQPDFKGALPKAIIG
jgi:hypothetical protein